MFKTKSQNLWFRCLTCHLNFEAAKIESSKDRIFGGHCHLAGCERTHAGISQRRLGKATSWEGRREKILGNFWDMAIAKSWGFGQRDRIFGHEMWKSQLQSCILWGRWFWDNSPWKCLGRRSRSAAGRWIHEWITSWRKDWSNCDYSFVYSMLLRHCWRHFLDFTSPVSRLVAWLAAF